MSQPTTIVFDGADLTGPAAARLAPLFAADPLAGDVKRLHARAGDDGEGLALIRQYARLPLRRLHSLAAYITTNDSIFYDPHYEIFVELLHSPCTAGLVRLTLEFMDGLEPDVAVFLSALESMPHLKHLVLDVYFLESDDDLGQFHPVCRLEWCEIRMLFPGFGVLLRNSGETLRTLAIADCGRFADHRWEDCLTAQELALTLRNVRQLYLHAMPCPDFAPVISACVRLRGFWIMQDTEMHDDDLIPAIKALRSPITHLTLPDSAYMHTNFLIEALGRPESPLHALRSMRLERWVAEVPTGQHALSFDDYLASRRIALLKDDT